jgi:hypothetical protein
MVEDESDVLAAKELKAEVHADIAEFNEENFTINECLDNDVADHENAEYIKEKQFNEMNRLENEFKLIETEVCFVSVLIFYN